MLFGDADAVGAVAGGADGLDARLAGGEIGLRRCRLRQGRGARMARAAAANWLEASDRSSPGTLPAVPRVWGDIDADVFALPADGAVGRRLRHAAPDRTADGRQPRRCPRRLRHGVDVTTAVAVRQRRHALVVGALVVAQRVAVAATPRQRWFLLSHRPRRRRRAERLPLFGRWHGCRSRSPCSLQHLPALGRALCAPALRPPRRAPRHPRHAPMLLGLALALDVLGAASGVGAGGSGSGSRRGVAFALAAAASFGLAPRLTQHEVGALDAPGCGRRSRWRSSPCSPSRRVSPPGRAASPARCRRRLVGLARATLLYGNRQSRSSSAS